MTAGRGIVHSERTAPDHRRDGEPLHGLQFWVGMPTKDEEIDPRFAHLDGKELPVVTAEGKTARIIAGSLFGARSPLLLPNERRTETDEGRVQLALAKRSLPVVAPAPKMVTLPKTATDAELKMIAGSAVWRSSR